MRLKELIGEQSVRAFSLDSGVSQGALRKYLDGQSLPGLDNLLAIARTGNVHVEWLATGEGPQMAGDKPKVGQAPGVSSVNVVDSEVLEDILLVLRARQDRRRRRFTPRNEARLVSEIYQYIIEQEQPTAEDRAKVLRLIDTIIGGTNVESSGTPGNG